MLEDLRERARRDHADRLTRLLDEVGTADLELETHVAHGSPSVLIPEIVREVEPALIVVGTVGRTGIAGLLVGNTAESIFAEVECPVMAIKPDGFQTPVRVEAA